MSKSDKNITVEEAISNLLYEHDCVIVPKFGGFVKEYKASNFDYVQGKISPPSSNLSFNENLVVDDGLLLDYYKKENGYNLKKAKEEVKQFAKKARLTLANKEVVSIPMVGRILMDYENQTKFISENHNFNTDTFGLPEVRYYPILREIPKIDHTIPSANTAATIATTAPKRRSQAWAKVAIPVFVLAVLISAIMVFTNKDNGNQLADTNDVEEPKDPSTMPVNISPKADDSEIDEELGFRDEVPESEMGTEGNNGAAEVETPVEEEPVVIEEEPVKEEAPVVTEPKVEKTVIFVGMFGQAKGVRTFSKKIENLGWTVYTEKTSNGNTRVGILVPEGEDAKAMLRKAQAKIEKGAFIKKR